MVNKRYFLENMIPSFLKIHEFFIVWCLETLHVSGTAMLFFLALPQLNSLR